jgi:RNA polymerase sporulation-specific sigma factor
MEWIAFFAFLFLLGCVSGGDSFKRPLTSEREAECLRGYRSGDEAAQKASKDELVECNLRLVQRIVNKYRLSSKNKEDLISIGTIGLMKAIETFKPEKGWKLSTYASKCIENEILMSLRAEKKYSREDSLQEPRGKDKNGNDVTRQDSLADDDKSVEEQAMIKILSVKLRDALRSGILDKRESQIINRRYGLNGESECTQIEIAEDLGISRSYVSRLEYRALGKLTAVLGE